MEEVSTGAMVPAVKIELKGASSGFTSPEFGGNTDEKTTDDKGVKVELDKELLCPICIQIIEDAFLTACGHSFCYMCIITHLNNKNDCPCCGNSLSTNQLFPNFVLDKLLKKASAQQISKTASPIEQFRQALHKVSLSSQSTIWNPVSQNKFAYYYLIDTAHRSAEDGPKKSRGRPKRIALRLSYAFQKTMEGRQGCEVSVKELDTLLSLLSDRKRKLVQEEAERNMQILLDFLHCLRKQKVDELKEIQTDLQFVKEDINVVERHRIDLYRARDRYSAKLQMFADDSTAVRSWSSSIEKNSSSLISSSRNVHGGMYTGNFQYKKLDGNTQVSALGPHKNDGFSISNSQHMSHSGLAVMRRKRVHSQFNDLQECYLRKRRQLANHVNKQEESRSNLIQREGYSAGLSDFQSVLTTFTQYSIEFDCDDELFATAGVSRRIKVFDFATVVNEHADVHCPVVEMSTRSKLSCLSWNKYTKNHLASSDYDGIVTVWDVTTRQSVMEYEEHEKRAWSVDFSRTEPSMLVSGSDDCKVKVWCTKQESSVFNIDMKANICCVKYNPGSSIHVAVGSADHHIHYYDLRNTSQPLHVFSGHKKAVSYVKFLSDNEVASASTDSTLRLWDVKEKLPIRTFKGHTNEKNFVGLSVNSEFIACGSETNEVFTYHKAISRPVTWHRYGSPDVDETDEEAGSYFISAVCWKSDSPTLLAANSQGTIKVLVLAP